MNHPVFEESSEPSFGEGFRPLLIAAVLFWSAIGVAVSLLGGTVWFVLK